MLYQSAVLSQRQVAGEQKAQVRQLGMAQRTGVARVEARIEHGAAWDL